MAKRLQQYREITLPMLKSLDEEERLRVVDGDKNDDKVIKLEIVRSGFLSLKILQEQV